MIFDLNHAARLMLEELFVRGLKCVGYCAIVAAVCGLFLFFLACAFLNVAL